MPKLIPYPNNELGPEIITIPPYTPIDDNLAPGSVIAWVRDTPIPSGWTEVSSTYGRDIFSAGGDYTTLCKSFGNIAITSIPESTVVSYLGNFELISNPSVDAEIYYSTNPDDPEESFTRYVSPITIEGPTTIRTYAIRDFYTKTYKTFNVTIAQEDPEITVSTSSGQIDYGSRVEISAASGWSIYYSTDGSNPFENGYAYTGSVLIDSNILKVGARKSPYDDVVQSFNYTLTNSPSYLLSENFESNTPKYTWNRTGTFDWRSAPWVNLDDLVAGEHVFDCLINDGIKSAVASYESNDELFFYFRLYFGDYGTLPIILDSNDNALVQIECDDGANYSLPADYVLVLRFDGLTYVLNNDASESIVDSYWIRYKRGNGSNGQLDLYYSYGTAVRGENPTIQITNHSLTECAAKIRIGNDASGAGSTVWDNVIVSTTEISGNNPIG